MVATERLAAMDSIVARAASHQRWDQRRHLALPEPAAPAEAELHGAYNAWGGSRSQKRFFIPPAMITLEHRPARHRALPPRNAR